MQLFSLIICFARFTDHIRDVTDIRPPDRGFSRQESGLESQDILSENPWKLKKKSFSPLAPPDSELDPDPQEDFCPDPDLQKKMRMRNTKIFL